MEEIKEAQLRQDRVQVRTLVDPTVSALDALRQAVVAQTALLRSLSEQVRLNQEAIVNWFSLNRKQQAKVNNQLVGLAERLDLHGKMFRNIHDRLELYSGFPEALLQVKGHLAAIEAKLASPDAERIFTPEELKKLEIDFKFKPLRTTRPAPKAAARRKTKR